MEYHETLPSSYDLTIATMNTKESHYLKRGVLDAPRLSYCFVVITEYHNQATYEIKCLIVALLQFQRNHGRGFGSRKAFLALEL